MKRIATIFALSLFFISQPFRASAGVVFLAAGVPMFIASDSKTVTTIGAMMANGALGFIGGGIFFLATGQPVFGVIFLSLGEDGSISQDQLEENLTAKYPFISDREVIKDLAVVIKKKAELQKVDKDGKIIVGLTESELNQILAPLDLKARERSQIIKGLK